MNPLKYAQTYVSDSLLPMVARTSRILPYQWTALPSSLDRNLSFDQFNTRSVSSNIVAWMGMPSPVSIAFGPTILESKNLFDKIAADEALVGTAYHSRHELAAHFLGSAGTEKGFGTSLDMPDDAGVYNVLPPTPNSSNNKAMGSSQKLYYDNTKDWHVASNNNVLPIPWIVPLEVCAAIILGAAHISGREAKITVKSRFLPVSMPLDQETQSKLEAAIEQCQKLFKTPILAVPDAVSFDSYLQTKPTSGIPGVRISPPLLKNMNEQVRSIVRSAQNGILSRVLLAAYVPTRPFNLKHRCLTRTPEGKEIVSADCFGYAPLANNASVRSILNVSSLQGVDGHIAVNAIATARLHDPSGEPARTVPLYVVRQAHQVLALFQILGLLPRDHIGLLLDAEDGFALDPSRRDPLPEQPKNANEAKLWTENCTRSYMDAAVEQYGPENCAPFSIGSITSNSGEVLVLPERHAARCGRKSAPKMRWGYFNGAYGGMIEEAAANARNNSRGPLSTVLFRVYSMNPALVQAFSQMFHSLPLPACTLLTLVRKLPDRYDDVAQQELSRPEHSQTEAYQKAFFRTSSWNRVQLYAPVLSLGRSRETSDSIQYARGWQQSGGFLDYKGSMIAKTVGLPWTIKPVTCVLGSPEITHTGRLKDLHEVSLRCITAAKSVIAKGGKASTSVIATAYAAEIKRVKDFEVA